MILDVGLKGRQAPTNCPRLDIYYDAVQKVTEFYEPDKRLWWVFGNVLR